MISIRITSDVADLDYTTFNVSPLKVYQILQILGPSKLPDKDTFMRMYVDVDPDYDDLSKP